MPIHVQDIYYSSNGDLWQLVQDTSTGDGLVRHTANLSSGGQITEQTVERFLSLNGAGPEFSALRALLADAPVPDRAGGGG